MTHRSLVLFAGIGLTLASVGCGAGHESPPASTRPPVPVRTATAASGQIANTFEAGGVVRARTSATLAARIMSTVRSVRVQPGDRVKAGQVLMVLDDRDLAATARQARSAVLAAEEGARGASSDRDAAQAALVLAQASHQRIADLFAKKSATQQELDEATAGLRAAEARRAAAEARVQQADASRAGASAGGEAASVMASYALITAPFDGLVTEKLVEPGNMVGPGTPLLRIEDVGAFRLEVRIDESRAQSLRLGDRAGVTVEAGQDVAAREMTGEVVELARAVDADSRTVLVKVALPATPGVTSGMFGKARFTAGQRTGITVPANAVVRRGQVTAVFVAAQDRAQLRLVSLGEASDGRVEVLAGIGAGETVLVDAPPGLVDGQPIRTGAAPAPAQGGRR
jgi:RND family efflux transporter MFP subunit